MSQLKAPFPYFGGKSKVASLVWSRFGQVDHYIEPFLGSGAVLLSNASPARFETVNDMNGLLCNFWRAVQRAPGALAEVCDWHVSELDLIARHNWMVARKDALTASLKADPEYFDLISAAWWVWGIGSWIGGGYTQKPINTKKPRLCTGNGIFPALGRGELDAWFSALSARLRGVRMICGSWDRLMVPTILEVGKTTAIFFDPPYDETICDSVSAYGVKSCSADVRAWCLDRGHDPGLRIALCGYEGEGHEQLEQEGWSVVAWKSGGGYANQGKGECRGKQNRDKERIWFSPACL